MTDWERFLWGALGSFSIEVIDLFLKLRQPQPQQPKYLKNPIYWPIRLGVVIVAGILAVVYCVDSKIVAFHIGVSAPLTIQAIALNADKKKDDLSTEN